MKNLFVLFLAAASLASAHDGYAAFDTTTEITLKGTVTDFHFVNPHSVVEFDVKDDKGQVQNWKAELTSANHLAPKGWSESTLQAGDELLLRAIARKMAPYRCGSPKSDWLMARRLSSTPPTKSARAPLASANSRRRARWPRPE